MIRHFIHWFESKTGVYLYPRFVVSVGALSIALILFAIVLSITHMYTESVKTITPTGPEAEAKYDAFMRRGSRILAPTQPVR
ncbi:MAG: hypothetical protein WAT81_01545 [Candidatus Moraniibacteriota bacterium]